MSRQKHSERAFLSAYLSMAAGCKINGTKFTAEKLAEELKVGTQTVVNRITKIRKDNPEKKYPEFDRKPRIEGKLTSEQMDEMLAEFYAAIERAANDESEVEADAETVEA